MMNTNSPEDFNIPSPERVALLERLQEVVGSVQPHTWAACQICDIESLAALLRLPPANLRLILRGTSDMVRHWGSSPGYKSQSTPKTPLAQTITASNSGLSPSAGPISQKRRRVLDSPGASNSDPSPSAGPISQKRRRVLDSPEALPRDSNAKILAAKRDNYCCILTGIRFMEVAHIYPHHSMKNKEENLSGKRHQFWDHLSLFWSSEKICAWQSQVFPQGIMEKGQEDVYNLISLSHHIHAMWGQGIFAFKPILMSDDKKTLKVQFFWQEKQMGAFPTMSLTTTPNSTQGLEQTAGIWLFDRSGQKIKSGDYFDLHTDDPVQKPLPSFELLELQWFLHRVQGMAGAVDFAWDDYLYNDSSSEIEETPELAFDDDVDVEEFSLLSGEPLSPAQLASGPSHPKNVAAEVEGHGAKGRDSVMQEERGYLVHRS